ncbi:DUF5412 family protein [Virgibacillus ihumii]|uniref:DUF5412 family protein n=1 Tax=Virgibacillus ihumii TaxID=2686091 RepID=UPI00248461AB|nr:DUF5412 family protein [Virgibacillus ihumii]
MLVATLSGFVLVSSIYVYEMYFFTFSEIDRGSTQKGPGPVTSPTGEYTASAYYELYGGAAGGVNVWVEITNDDENDKKKTIYYSDANKSISLEWANEDTLFIKNEKNSMKLNVEKEIYHDRGLVCQSLLMKDEYETCYQN